MFGIEKYIEILTQSHTFEQNIFLFFFIHNSHFSSSSSVASLGMSKAYIKRNKQKINILKLFFLMCVLWLFNFENFGRMCLLRL